MGAIPPATDDLSAEVAVLRKAMEELVTKRNFLLNDANAAFVIVEKGIVAHENGFQEHERKLGVAEAAVIALDKSFASCDVWLRALSQDMSDNVKTMLVEADKKAAMVIQRVEGMDEAMAALDVAHRLQTLETSLGPAILNRGHSAEGGRVDGRRRDGPHRRAGHQDRGP